ncbi:ThuA domain-containing protein [Streptomyces violaceus]|uniref:ThuA domain-containing protein n=1 Tax=Streptomyces violaceus TaxID=1936 RepID=UPI0031E5A152
MTQKRALVVRGGWEGHEPVRRRSCFLPFLRDNGYAVRVEESTDVYADTAEMAGTDLVVQCVTMSEITREQVAGLSSAVVAGTGFTGWHGGIADSFRACADYLHLVGGQFATHPGKEPCERRGGAEDNFLPHTITLTEARPRPPRHGGHRGLRAGHRAVLGAPRRPHRRPGHHDASRRPWQPWHRPVTSPAVWTRRWGAGRVLVTTPGHSLDVLEHPDVRTIIERGMLWATRTASAS